MEGIVGGSGYTLSELEREFQAAVVHHQFEDRFRVDIRRTVGWNVRVLLRASQERDQRLSHDPARVTRPGRARSAEHARMGNGHPPGASAIRLGPSIADYSE